MKTTLFPGTLLAIVLVPLWLLGHPQAQKPSSEGNDATFNFIVTAKSGKPRQGETVMLRNKKTGKVFSGQTGPDGKGTVIIPSANTYTICYKFFGDTVKYKDIEVPGGDHRVTYTYTMKYDPPRSITLKNVFFETGKATLKHESDAALNDLADALRAKPAMVVEIAGHTDDVGSAEANQQLSLDRANAVRDYLIRHGIAASRVTAAGYGETQPVADNNTPDGRQLNRRTEVRIISE